MKKSLSVLCTMLLIAACVISSCGKKKTPEMPQVKYETKVLKPESRTYNMTFPASLEGVNEAKVYPQVEGIIKSKNYTSGTLVHKGQTLFVIDPTEYRLSVQSAEAQLSVAKAKLETTKLQYESNQQLYAQKVISDYVLKTSLNDYNSAKASVQQAEAQLNIARTNLGYCSVTAPFEGYISSNNLGVGDMATKGNYLCTVSDHREIKADFSMDESQMLHIIQEFQLKVTEKGMVDPNGKYARETLPPVKLKLKDGSTYKFEGRLTRLDATLNEGTGTASCEASFSNPDGVLRSGLTATVILPIQFDSVLVVPQTAAVNLQDQKMFYRIKKDGTVEGILCEVYPSDDGKEYFIMSGLNPGDEVVTNGVRKLSNGMKIR
jgi:membrane fusion protein (multidrug efflux system)